MTNERKDIEARYKWDLSVIYPSETEFYADYAKAEKAIKAFSKYEAVMCSSAKDLYNTLKSLTDLEALINKLFQYASLNFSVGTIPRRNPMSVIICHGMLRRKRGCRLNSKR